MEFAITLKLSAVGEAVGLTTVANSHLTVDSSKIVMVLFRFVFTKIEIKTSLLMYFCNKQLVWNWASDCERDLSFLKVFGKLIRP